MVKDILTNVVYNGTFCIATFLLGPWGFSYNNIDNFWIPPGFAVTSTSNVDTSSSLGEL